jgi:hypothetical protein
MKTINDGLSKQRRYQLRQQALGRCVQCGSVKEFPKCKKCDRCRDLEHASYKLRYVPRTKKP